MRNVPLTVSLFKHLPLYPIGQQVDVSVILSLLQPSLDLGNLRLDFRGSTWSMSAACQHRATPVPFKSAILYLSLVHHLLLPPVPVLHLPRCVRAFIGKQGGAVSGGVPARLQNCLDRFHLADVIFRLRSQFALVQAVYMCVSLSVGISLYFTPLLLVSLSRSHSQTHF